MPTAGTFQVTQAVQGHTIPSPLQFERLSGALVPKSLRTTFVESPGIDGGDVKWQSKAPTEFTLAGEFVTPDVTTMNQRTTLFESHKGRIGTLTMPGSQSLTLVCMSGRSSYGPLRRVRGVGGGAVGSDMYARAVQLIFAQVG